MEIRKFSYTNNQKIDINIEEQLSGKIGKQEYKITIYDKHKKEFAVATTYGKDPNKARIAALHATQIFIKNLSSNDIFKLTDSELTRFDASVEGKELQKLEQTIIIKSNYKHKIKSLNLKYRDPAKITGYVKGLFSKSAENGYVKL